MMCAAASPAQHAIIARESPIMNINYTIECLPEDLPIKGNASAIDDETDAAIEARIIDELEWDNHWAWCCVKVSAVLLGQDGKPTVLSGADYLGCCSYHDEDVFRSGGYFDGMKEQARDDLLRQVKDIQNAL